MVRPILESTTTVHTFGKVQIHYLPNSELYEISIVPHARAIRIDKTILGVSGITKTLNGAVAMQSTMLLRLILIKQKARRMK